MNIAELTNIETKLLEYIKSMGDEYMDKIQELTRQLDELSGSNKSQQYIKDQSDKLKLKIDEIKNNFRSKIDSLEDSVKKQISSAIERKSKSTVANLSARFGIDTKI